MSEPALHDSYGRRVTYLRLSVTDRCNLRCFYCLPRERASSGRHELLALDEIAATVRVGISLGIEKVRITGGEPLTRPGVVDFVRAIAAVPGVRDLALSTNGTLLAEHAGALRAAGLARVNVSLDSVRPEVFRAVSGRSDLARVIAGIDAARTAGLAPIKLNVVVMRGINDDELPALLAFAADHGAQARLIEYMPLGLGRRWEASYVSRGKMLERLRPFLADRSPRHQRGDTAAYYPLRDGGEVGIISPVSCRFCDRCNRLRLTADGKLRPCLTSEGEVDVRPALRPTVSPSALASCFRAATAGRPRQGTYLDEEPVRLAAAPRSMAAIGG